jgi:membrane associated rhomboid family serine protease
MDVDHHQCRTGKSKRSSEGTNFASVQLAILIILARINVKRRDAGSNPRCLERPDGYIPAALLAGVWFLMQFLSLGAVAPEPAGGVAYAAHVGGFIFGAVTARFFEPPR